MHRIENSTIIGLTPHREGSVRSANCQKWSGGGNAWFGGHKIGGTMAGEFTAGLSGGQRKMFLFELVRQRNMAKAASLAAAHAAMHRCGITPALPGLITGL